MTARLNIAAVLPRFDRDLGGGAEALCRALLLRLRDREEVASVQVWTTCARDHRTWENSFPTGVTIEDGIAVHRFPVDERNLNIFIERELAIQEGRPLSIDEQLDWLAQSVNSRDLYQHIATSANSVDVILFAPYLFATTFWGSLICPEKSLLVPCLHNECYAYLPVMRALFQKVKGLMFNASPEGELAAQLFPLARVKEKGHVVGMGFDVQQIVETAGDNSLSEKVSAILSRPYILYSGRKEGGKNVELLLREFQKFSQRAPQDSTLSKLHLVLIGSGELSAELSADGSLPDTICDLGFVSEVEKYSLMKNALALCQPSKNESFSIVLMEAWALGTPVIVHSDCAVTFDHVLKSQGGLFFSRPEELSGIFEFLLSDADARRQLGQNGLEYVQTEYSWDAVESRFFSALEKLGLLARKPSLEGSESVAV